MLVAGLMIVNIFLGVVGQFLIKFGVNRIGVFGEVPALLFFKSAFLSPFIVFGIGLYAVSSIIWLVLLSKVDLSFAYPMISLGYVLVLFVSWAFLSEVITPMRIFGVLMICSGVLFIFRS